MENAVIANGRKELNWKVSQVGAWPPSFPFFINGAKEAAEGTMMAQAFIAEPSNERRAAFLGAYKRKFKQTLTVPRATIASTCWRFRCLARATATPRALWSRPR